MPTTPYAKLLVTVNPPGAPVSGAIFPPDGATIRFSAESTVGWTHQKYELFDYPEGMPLPAGWTDGGDGTYYYALDPFPPTFVVHPWGKYMARLTVNNGIDGAGKLDPTLVDESTALSVFSPHGLADLGFLELGQFDSEKEWTGDQKANLRIIEAGIGGFTPGGDLTGTSTSQTVSAIQGLPTSSGLFTSVGEVAVIGYLPVWHTPKDIAWDGTNLWVADSSSNFVTKGPPGFFTHTNYTLPTGCRAQRVTTGGGMIFLACTQTGVGNNNKLVVLDGTSGAVLGIGAYPAGFAFPVGIALDTHGNVWTVDPTNGLTSWSIAALVAAGGTPVAPNHTFAGPGGLLDVVSDGTTYLYVCNGTGHGIGQFDPVAVNFTGPPYVDGMGRTINHVFFAVGSVWATTATAGHLLQINPAGLGLTNDIAQGGSAISLGNMASDGANIFVSDASSGRVEMFSIGGAVWSAEFTSFPYIPATSSGGMAFDGSAVNVVGKTTSPTGLQGVAQFLSFGFVGFFIGGNQLQYKTGSAIGVYDTTPNTLPLRGVSGEALFGWVGEASSGIAGDGFIRCTAASGTLVATQSTANPLNDINFLRKDSVYGTDAVVVGDVNSGGLVLLGDPSTGVYVTSGGPVRIDSKRFELGATAATQLVITPTPWSYGLAGTFVFDGDSFGSTFDLTLTSSITFGVPTSILAGGRYTFIVRQTGGPWTAAWDVAFHFGSMFSGDLSDVPGAVDIFEFIGGAAGVLYCIGTSKNVTAANAYETNPSGTFTVSFADWAGLGGATTHDYVLPALPARARLLAVVVENWNAFDDPTHGTFVMSLGFSPTTNNVRQTSDIALGATGYPQAFIGSSPWDGAVGQVGFLGCFVEGEQPMLHIASSVALSTANAGSMYVRLFYFFG